jgi:hypothetical protein
MVVHGIGGQLQLLLQVQLVPQEFVELLPLLLELGSEILDIVGTLLFLSQFLLDICVLGPVELGLELLVRGLLLGFQVLFELLIPDIGLFAFILKGVFLIVQHQS